jgi:flagellar biosynthesis protein FlhF
MNIRKYRAKTMREALELVRGELGPDAAVLQTREVRGWFPWLTRGQTIEVTASDAVHVPSRLPDRLRQRLGGERLGEVPSGTPTPAHLEHDYRSQFRNDVKNQLDELHSMVEKLCTLTPRAPQRELPEALFRVFTDLIEADVSEELARELIEAARASADPEELADATTVKARIARQLENEMAPNRPIEVSAGRRRLAALVGPTGVGKTTTIAKLAANFRLREKLRVGLITVDTYRIAAVEQLRTYADIIDLPMEVVATPRQMREAVARMDGLDLVLLDTAGRSPHDEIRIQELKSLLAEAQADEVHLVLSATAGAANLASTAAKFAEVGVTALAITKLDEAAGLGNLLPLLRGSRLPVSYLTNGQNVPDDIRIADRHWLAGSILQVKEH